MSIRIVVEVDGAGRRAVADATRMVSADLRARGIAVEPAVTEAPAGSKGTVTDIAMLVVTSALSASTINALSRVLIARIRARTATKARIIDGDRTLEINANTSAEEFQVLIEAFQKPADQTDA